MSTPKSKLPTWAIVAVLVLMIGISLMAAGCGGVSDPANRWREQTVELEDGREVVCVTWQHMNAGGMSCDWRNAE